MAKHVLHWSLDVDRRLKRRFRRSLVVRLCRPPLSGFQTRVDRGTTWTTGS